MTEIVEVVAAQASVVEVVAAGGPPGPKGDPGVIAVYEQPDAPTEPVDIGALWIDTDQPTPSGGGGGGGMLAHAETNASFYFNTNVEQVILTTPAVSFDGATTIQIDSFVHASLEDETVFRFYIVEDGTPRGIYIAELDLGYGQTGSFSIRPSQFITPPAGSHSYGIMAATSQPTDSSSINPSGLSMWISLTVAA